MSEKDVLKGLAIKKYNEQYGSSFTVDEFDIFSIPTRNSFYRSYEMFTTRTDDFLRLHMHLTVGKSDNLRPFRLELDGSEGVGVLTDEIFVTTGTIDSYHLEQGQVKLGLISSDDVNLPYLLDETGLALYMEDGTTIDLETM